MKRFWIGLAFLGALGSGAVWAAGGADALMKALPPGAGAPAEAPKAMLEGGINLSDPFLVQFYTSWSQQQNLPYEVNLWALNVLKGKHAEAAHLWGVLNTRVPASFQRAASTAQLYLLYQLGASQTFFDQWMDKLASADFRNSPEERALEQVLLPTIDSFLVDRAINLNKTQRNFIATLDPKKSYVWANLQGWAFLREGTKGEKLLEILPHNNKLKIPLTQTVVLSLARKKQIDKAAHVLKRHLEPAIEAAQDTTSLASYYLQIARLLYQVGSLEGAEQFYAKVPSGTPQYLNAQEELLWVWLRQGKRDQVRGTLASFDTGLFDDKFAPDIYVVRSISNLKLCYYDKAQQDLEEFGKTYGPWAKKIEKGEKDSDPSSLEVDSLYVGLGKRAVAQREKESEQLQNLHDASIEAALPAVGKQVYWERAQKTLMGSLEAARQQLALEYRQEWKNRKIILAEAIRKMNFVKVELLSQLQRYAKSEVPSAESKVALNKAPGELTFPFDGVVWADELFKLRGLAQAQCLQGE